MAGRRTTTALCRRALLVALLVGVPATPSAQAFPLAPDAWPGGRTEVAHGHLAEKGRSLSRLRDRAERRAPAAAPARTPTAPPAPPSPPAVSAFTVASFNVLGSNHTPRGSGWADGVTRARWASDLVLRRGFDVVGLQEVQVDQLATMMAATGGAFTSYPPLGERGPGVPQAIIWRVDTWEVVAATTFTIPFVGERRPQPVVLLQHRQTGQQVWFVNVHFSPRRDRRDGEGERNEATALLIAQVRELQTTGLPVVVVGDMNEHGEIYCDLATATGLRAAQGGSTAGGCRPPRSRVDWVFGSRALTWTGFAYQEDPEVRRITDHALAVAQVRVVG